MARSETESSLRNALAALEGERQRIDEAANALRSMLQSLGVTSRASSGAGRTSAKTARRKPRWTPAMKAAAKARMRRYWASKRRDEKPSTPAKSSRKAKKVSRAEAPAK